MDKDTRRIATELIVAGGLTAIGIYFGNPTILAGLVGLAGSAGADWLTDLAKRGYQSWSRRWFSAPVGTLNQDVAQALEQAYGNAVEELSRTWRRQDAYSRLSPEEQTLTREGFGLLKAQGIQALSRLQAEPASLPQEITGLLTQGEPDQVQQTLKEPLATFFHGYPQPFLDFLTNNLTSLWLAHFRDLLKSSDGIGTRAWRALQMSWQAALTETLTGMQQDVAESRAILEWLQAWAQRLEALPPTQRDETGWSVLEEVVASALDDLRQGQERIEGKINEVLDRLPPTPPRPTQLQLFTPPPARRLFGRETILEDLVQELCQSNGPGRPLALTALQGLPGVGKTALALALAHHPQVQDAFPDGVLWIPLGPELDREQLPSLLDRLIAHLGGSPEGLESLEARRAALQTLLQGKRTLLILDDMWKSEVARPFTQACAPPAQALITTREAREAGDLDAALRQVKVLSLKAGVDMLADAGEEAAQAVAADPAGAEALVQALGSLPLALEVAGRYLASLARADGPAHAVDTLRQELAEEERRILELRARQ